MYNMIKIINTAVHYKQKLRGQTLVVIIIRRKLLFYLFSVVSI